MLAEFEAEGFPHLEASPDEVNEALERSMGYVWQKGVGEYIKRIAERMQVEPESAEGNL